jgi:SAM-dependent methyltransferase
MSVPYSTVCSIEHFDDPDLAGWLCDIWADVLPSGSGWRTDLADRKAWEVAMAVRTLDQWGALRDDAEILGIGAGAEPTLFELTNRVRRVFATDLYLNPGDWSHTAHTTMLAEPERYWTGSWNPRRLVVQHMNALDLRYEDASFAGIFSSSSLEHFGTHDDVRQAMREMHRVLEPGGICSISTEFRVAGPGPGMPGILMFDEQEVADVIVGSAEWELVDGAVDVEPSPQTLSVVASFEQAADDVREQRGAWSVYPHLVLDHQDGPRTWTSIHIALRKPGGSA